MHFTPVMVCFLVPQESSNTLKAGIPLYALSPPYALGQGTGGTRCNMMHFYW